MLNSIVKDIENAIKSSKEQVYKLENTCKNCPNRFYVHKWVKATKTDIENIKRGIKNAYELSIKKCTHGRYQMKTQILSIFTALRAFEKQLPDKRWIVYDSTPHGPSLIENKESGKVYYLFAWESSRQVSGPQIYKTLALKAFKGKSIDYKILIARNKFSSSAIKLGQKYENITFIELGMNDEEENKFKLALSGCLDASDPLISRFISFLSSYEERPEDRAITISSSLDPFLIGEVLRAFKEHFHLRDCGHLHISKKAEQYPIFPRDVAEPTFEERLKRVGMIYSQEDAMEKLNELKKVYNELQMKIDQFYQSDLVFTLVKKDIDGNLRKNEVLFLCKSCGPSFVDKYEFSPQCEGLECVFKKFVELLGKHLGSEAEFIDVYDIGILKLPKGNIIISRGRIHQPAENLALFNPILIVSICNFFSDNYIMEGLHYRWYPVESRLTPEEHADVNSVALETAINYLIPVLAFDCSADQSVFVPIRVAPSDLVNIVKRLTSIEFSVKPSERAYKAAHDRIMELCRDIGLEFGFIPEMEYRIGNERIDVAWIDRKTGILKVAIEVELSGSILGDLWKICEANPDIGILIVKGRYFKTAAEHVMKSNIIKKMNQTIMILDISEKNYVIIKGREVLRVLDN